MNKTSKSARYKILIWSLLCLGLITAITVLAQTSKNQKEMKIDLSSPVNADKTPKIVAIRRINVITEKTDENGARQVKVPFVEIELAVGASHTDTNLMEVVRIGQVDFIVYDWTSSGNVRLLLEPRDFDELRDGDEVSFRVGAAEEKEKLKQSFANGTAQPVVGRHIGKLDKKIIDQKPAVDRQLNEKL